MSGVRQRVWFPDPYILLLLGTVAVAALLPARGAAAGRRGVRRHAPPVRRPVASCRVVGPRRPVRTRRGSRAQMIPLTLQIFVLVLILLDVRPSGSVGVRKCSGALESRV